MKKQKLKMFAMSALSAFLITTLVIPTEAFASSTDSGRRGMRGSSRSSSSSSRSGSASNSGSRSSGSNRSTPSKPSSPKSSSSNSGKYVAPRGGSNNKGYSGVSNKPSTRNSSESSSGSESSNSGSGSGSTPTPSKPSPRSGSSNSGGSGKTGGSATHNDAYRPSRPKRGSDSLIPSPGSPKITSVNVSATTKKQSSGMYENTMFYDKQSTTKNIDDLYSDVYNSLGLSSTPKDDDTYVYGNYGKKENVHRESCTQSDNTFICNAEYSLGKQSKGFGVSTRTKHTGADRRNLSAPPKNPNLHTRLNEWTGDVSKTTIKNVTQNEDKFNIEYNVEYISATNMSLLLRNKAVQFELMKRSEPDTEYGRAYRSLSQQEKDSIDKFINVVVKKSKNQSMTTDETDYYNKLVKPCTNCSLYTPTNGVNAYDYIKNNFDSIKGVKSGDLESNSEFNKMSTIAYKSISLAKSEIEKERKAAEEAKKAQENSTTTPTPPSDNTSENVDNTNGNTSQAEPIIPSNPNYNTGTPDGAVLPKVPLDDNNRPHQPQNGNNSINQCMCKKK